MTGRMRRWAVDAATLLERPNVILLAVPLGALYVGVVQIAGARALAGTGGPFLLAVVALGEDLADARARAYAGVAEISWAGEQHRGDIARKAAQGGIAVPAP